ncbi:UNVERIFIED_CONTAM: hypothetical protein PYX00_006616 [Menopon gallinae]|uniref:Vacuolar protein sorting-associated protein 53 homolog n=1 Tax=Menopon gallinae TaxID=328185 RepID=A0AAW2HWW5_9NEOP
MSTQDDSTLNVEDPEYIIFPPEVQSAIDQVLPSKDPIDQPDFNVVDYINSICPTEQSLSNIDEVIANLETKINSIDDEMRMVIRGQTSLSKDGHTALEKAKQVIKQLLAHADKIRNQAEESEGTVQEITRDIKQLDTGKHNLTIAITTLNHLHMLASGVDTLKVLTSNRQYGEIILPLQGIGEVLEHFHNYLDIPQVSQLNSEVREIRVLLAKQITSDFHAAFSESNIKHSIPLTKLSEACKVVSVLEPEVKNDLLKWFINLQLVEYMHLFQENQDSAWLDKIDKRYVWLKRHLLDFEEKFGVMFPPEWEVSERITVEFCKLTRSELSKVMGKRIAELDVKLLLYAIQKTDSFENLLARRFSGITLCPDSVHKEIPSLNPFESIPDNKTLNELEESESSMKSANRTHPFHKIIGQCFEPHLHVYVESLDRNLLDLMERFVVDTPKHFDVNEMSETEATVLPSCADLFVFYKKCLVQCSQLSTSTTMLQLSHTFQKYLREYALKILQNNLPKVTNVSGSISGGISTLTRAEVAAGFIQNLLKEGSRLERNEQRRICTILTTAEYCLETVQQLEDKLKEKIDKELADKVNMSQEQDIFHNVISSSIQLLVQDLETACDASLAVMTKMNWQSVESVGDQSPYVTAISGHLKATVPLIRDQLASSRKYFTQFCVKFSSIFIPKFISSLYKCRAISTVGAEQLLLDTHSLKTVLLEMPSLGSQIQRKAPPSYTKNVVKGMGKAEMILKVVMSPTVPEKAFVDQVAKLLPETDQTEFQKLLEMKGIKRNEQHVLLELRRKKGPVPAATPLTNPDHEASRIKKLEKLIKGSNIQFRL